MTLAALSLPLVVAALFLGAAWLASLVVLPTWSGLVRRWPAMAGTAPLASTLPWLAGAALALGALLPGDPHTGQVLACHCLESMPAWLHLCPVHPETAASLAPPAACVLIALLPGRGRAALRLVREPLGLGGGSQPRVVALGAPMALLHGWLRPTLVVDRALWLALSTPERQAVLAHERAHLARRDPLVRVGLHALLALAPSPLASRVVRTWLDHAEHRADAEGARVVGDPTVIARALVRCARLGAGSPHLALAWTGGQLERRVEALVRGRPASSPARPDVGLRDVAILSGLGGLTLLGSPWVHHQVEHLLNLSL